MSEPDNKSGGPAAAKSTRPSTSPAWGRRWRRSEPFRRRVATGAAASLLATLLVTVGDVFWMRQGLEAAPPVVAALSTQLGLLAPLGLIVGVAVGVASWLLQPRSEPTIRRLLGRLRTAGPGRQADVAALVPLLVVGMFAWATLSAALAKLALNVDAPPHMVGALLAAGGLLLALFCSVCVMALAPWLKRHLARSSSNWPSLVDPTVTLGLSLIFVAGMLALGVSSGTASGDGSLLGIYGIFKRQELDLRVVGMLLLLVASAALGPAWLRRLKPYQALTAALLPLLLTVSAATVLNRQPDLAQLVLRAAPVGKLPLKVLRRLTDRDGDGASAWFGGGDCDDQNRNIGPGSDDIPDNGVDEDCSGSDLSMAGIAPPPLPPKPVGAIAGLPENTNLVLITVDTLRSDLGYMGYKRAVSPNLDALAKRSFVYERAYSLASYTGKSVGPMLIGKYGSETHRNWGHFNTFSKEDTFIAERFQTAGIKTAAVHGHRYFGDFGGLDRGFDEVDMSAAPPKSAEWAKDSTITSVKLTDAAIRHYDAAKGKRLFMWVHYLDPHAAYRSHKDIKPFGSNARALYDGEVAFTDKHIGRLLDHIGASEAAARTAIIVTSDHGEAFDDNKMWRHGVELWEALVRVPLIVHVPNIGTKRISVRRSLIDLAPTMLDIMGLKKPPSATTSKDDDFMSGISWAADWSAPPAKRDVLVDMPGGPYNESRRAFIHDDLKLIVSRGADKELFNLADDPKERRNLWRTKRGDIEAHYAATKKRLREIVVTGKRK